ncbi:MAG: outer membrane beta-barrel family protein, partial [Muribaculaceae bacterium]|nr:outer membrane beta-barrel family protein [Muribaculaceae bacterium]
IEGSFDIRYNPKNWLSFSINGGVGKRWLSSDHPMLRQDNIFYRITPRIDFYLPNHFRVGGHYGLYKNLPDPWSSRSSLSLYSFYVSKSFVRGRLNVTLTANSPFTRYNLNHVHTSLPTMEREQNNYITARSFGVNISYSFGGGKRVNVERDRSLETKDISTGVR